MARKRQTIKVEELVQLVNHRNRISTCGPLIREGWNSFLEEVLYKTNRYNGFVYLDLGEVPPGEKPGIVKGEKPSENVFPDETRRTYCINRMKKRE